jgi:hypothetical protein
LPNDFDYKTIRIAILHSEYHSNKEEVKLNGTTSNRI